MSSPSLDAHPRLEQWLRFEADGTVSVLCGKVEIGQRISSAIAGIVAAELAMGPERVRIAPVRTGESPDEGITSGSNSIEHAGEAVRLAAATARHRLLALAAARLGAAVDALDLADGLVRERGSNRSVSYRELAPDGRLAGAVDTALDDAPAVLPAERARAIAAARAAALVTGRVRFLHDLAPPDALHARVVRPPHSGARLAQVDEAAIQGLGDASLIRCGSFLGVAAADPFQATRAARRVAGAVTWDAGDGVACGDVFEALAHNRRTSLPVVDGAPVDAPLPDAAPAPADAVVSLEASYRRPYQMHASIGPSAAMARLADGLLTVWTHSQGVYPLRASLAEALGMPEDRVQVEHVAGAGCYGHNGADDAALDAALVARACPGRTVHLTWSREDEHGYEPYGSAMLVRLRASIDTAGRIRGWRHEAYSDTHRGRPRPGPGGAGPARLLAARWLPAPPPPFVATPNRGVHAGLHRNAEPYYDLPGAQVLKHLVHDLPLRTSALRTLGGFANVFAIESFVDELAHAAASDPLALRLAHLGDPRAREVLTRAAAALGLRDAARAEGRGHGIAFARYKNRQAYVAAAVAVTVDAAAVVHLERAVIAADAGRIVDADGLAAQMEGGFLQAASWTLYEEVTWDRDGVTSRDWDGYPILRFDNVPAIVVDLVDRRDAPPLGAGEAACGPAGAAIANAVFDATGLRVRRLPLTPHALRAVALEEG